MTPNDVVIDVVTFILMFHARAHVLVVIYSRDIVDVRMV